MSPKAKKKSEMSSEELKAAIVKVAAKHFAMQGFNGASLKAIAADSGVAGSLINYHFKDKEGLFHAVIEPFARGRMEAIKSLLSEPKSPDEMKVRLELFVEHMQSSIINSLDTFEIIDRELKAANPIILKIFEETMLQAFKWVVNFFKQAQKNELLREELDPLMLSTLLFTSTCDSCRKNVLAKKFFNVSFEDPEFRKKYALHVAGLFLRGVMR